MRLFDQLNSLVDVQRLLIDEGVREGETIDYKQLKNWSKDDSPAEVAKDASAFANSAGGLLVYGVGTRKVNDSTVPEAIVGLERALIPNVQRAISDLIRHPIPGVRWKSLQRSDNPEVFLVDIPASPLAPHQQARNRIYYRRDGDQSLPMPHELVELYFGRRLGPVLIPLVGELAKVTRPSGGQLEFDDVSVTVTNVGAALARDMLLVVRSANQRCRLGIASAGWRSEIRNSANEVARLNALPGEILHPTDLICVCSLKIGLSVDEIEQQRALFDLQLFASQMAPRTVRFAIRDHSPGATAFEAYEVALETS